MNKKDTIHDSIPILYFTILESMVTIVPYMISISTSIALSTIR